MYLCLYVQQHAHTNLISSALCCLNALIPYSSAIFKPCSIRNCRRNSPYRLNSETTALLVINIQFMLQLFLDTACWLLVSGYHGYWRTLNCEGNLIYCQFCTCWVRKSQPDDVLPWPLAPFRLNIWFGGKERIELMGSPWWWDTDSPSGGLHIVKPFTRESWE